MRSGVRENCSKEAFGEAHDVPDGTLEHNPHRRDEGRERGVRRLARRSVTEERSHHKSEIERGEVGEIPLSDVLASAQSYAAVSAGLARESEGIRCRRSCAC